MNLQIDIEKLKAIINGEVNDLANQSFLSESSVTIGRFKGFEVQIKVTREEDDFIEGDDYICVTEVK